MEASLLPSFSVAGQVTLITGGGKGIGQHLAQVFAEAGARVVLTSREAARAEAAAAAIQARGGHAVGLPLDLVSIDGIRATVDWIVEEFGQLDILINNAGSFHIGDSLEITPEQWDLVVNTHLRGTFFCSQAAGRHMVRQGRGKIITIVSQMGFVTLPGRAAYSSAKAGAIHLTRVLAQEWAKAGVNVNAIAPTYINSRPERMADSPFRDFVIAHIPMGRLGELRDLAGAALFLASPASDFITGHTLVVDGGWLTM